MDVRTKRLKVATRQVSKMLVAPEVRASMPDFGPDGIAVVTLLHDDTVGVMFKQVDSKGGRACVAVVDDDTPTRIAMMTVSSDEPVGRHRALEENTIHACSELGLLVDYMESAKIKRYEFRVTSGETVVELDYQSRGDDLLTC